MLLLFFLQDMQYVNLIFSRFFRDVLKFLNGKILSFCVCHPCCQFLLQHESRLVVQWFIYCKKYSLIKQNKNY